MGLGDGFAEFLELQLERIEHATELGSALFLKALGFCIKDLLGKILEGFAQTLFGLVQKLQFRRGGLGLFGRTGAQPGVFAGQRVESCAGAVERLTLIGQLDEQLLGLRLMPRGIGQAVLQALFDDVVLALHRIDIGIKRLHSRGCAVALRDQRHHFSIAARLAGERCHANPAGPQQEHHDCSENKAEQAGNDQPRQFKGLRHASSPATTVTHDRRGCSQKSRRHNEKRRPKAALIDGIACKSGLDEPAGAPTLCCDALSGKQRACSTDGTAAVEFTVCTVLIRREFRVFLHVDLGVIFDVAKRLGGWVVEFERRQVGSKCRLRDQSCGERCSDCADHGELQKRATILDGDWLGHDDSVAVS